MNLHSYKYEDHQNIVKIGSQINDKKDLFKEVLKTIDCIKSSKRSLSYSFPSQNT